MPSYSNVQSIIDCLEIEIEKPSNAIHQSLTWSEYKNVNTLKYLHILPFVKSDRRQTGNLTAPQSPSTAEDLDEEDDFEDVAPGSDLEQSTFNVESSAPSDPSTLDKREEITRVQRPPVTKRKIDADKCFVEYLEAKKKNMTHESADQKFLLSLLPDMEEMTAVQKRQFI